MSLHHVPTLYVVATPIGNLQDITLRALEVLKTVDAIAAEDTRHTSHLLSHFAIQKKLIAVHEHNEQKSAQILLERVQAGESIALVTDAGTPGISDPGAIVVDVLRDAGVNVVPVPGASAVIAALSASGITATVAAEVCTRPCVSVLGTRCTRCTPLSNFMVPYTSSPVTSNITSL